MATRPSLSCTAVALALTLSGCGPAMISASLYAEQSGQSADIFAPFVAGQRLALFAARDRCGIMVGRTTRDLTTGNKLQDLSEVFPGPKLTQATVADVGVLLHEDPAQRWVAVEITTADGQRAWLRVPPEQELDCVYPWSPALDTALAILDNELVFAPWRAECQELAMAGRTALTTLVDSSTDDAFVAHSVRLGPEDLRAYLNKRSGPIPWLVLGDTGLEVRSDVALNCFAPKSDPRARRPAEVERVVRTFPGVCTQLGGDAASSECRSTVGAWIGEVMDRGVQVKFTQRNLGPVRVANGKPVTGVRFAKTLVSVTTATPGNARIAKLYDAVRKVINEAASRAIDDVAVVATEAPSADYTFRVALSNLALGSVSERLEPATSEFIARYDEHPNPAYAQAEVAVSQAEAGVAEAKANYDTAMQQYEASKAQCDSAADQASSMTGNTWVKLLVAAGNVACQVATMPSMDETVEAQSKLAQARATLAATSRTKRVPVNETWRYTKKMYRREATATLRLTLSRKAGGAPQVLTLPVRYTWEDYDVAADPAHNVQGHAVDPEPVRNADALLPGLGKAVTAELQRALDTAIASSTLEQARAALAASGSGPSDPAELEVDAAAFLATRDRLVKNVRRGRTEITAASAALSTAGLKLDTDQCVLLVALPDSGEAQKLKLRAGDGYWADERGATPAYLELCSTDRRALPPDVQISADAKGWVRWGLYVTQRTKAPQPSTKPAPAPAPAPTSTGTPTAVPDPQSAPTQ